jgi:uncharacterized protein Yka (UPF0111/DUF47 family)
MKNKEIEELLDRLKDVAKRHTIEVREYGVVETIPSSISKELRLNSYSANLLFSHIEQLEKDNKDLDKENQMLFESNLKLENNRDKAIEVINTQLKNAEGGAKDNLRIIKFNLIKGSCTFEDLKTEEDYKYILKGDSDE